MWNLCAQVAEKYYQEKCFLMGDSAHSFPPAGPLKNENYSHA